MKLSEKAEEVLEALWVAVEEEGQAFLDPAAMGFPADDPAYRELTGHTLIEIRKGMVYFRPEGREEGKITIRRHRLAERLLMDVLNIRGDEGEYKACQFEHLLNAQTAQPLRRLAGDHTRRLAGLIFGQRLANAHNRRQTNRQGGLELLIHGFIRFAEIGAALGVPQDDVLAQLSHHLR